MFKMNGNEQNKLFNSINIKEKRIDSNTINILKNSKGKSTFLIVITTMIITMLLCFVIFKIVNIYEVLTEEEITYSLSDFTKLKRVKSIVDEAYLREYDEEVLMDSTIAGLLAGLDDPYAAYYNKAAFESFNTQTEGEYEGIGIYVSYDEEKHMPIIISPIAGSPAASSGIRPGDYIEYVDDLQAANVDYERLVDAIKGRVGTKVRLGLIRYNEDESYEEIELEVERQKVNINPIEADVYDGNVGYIKMSSFDEVSYKEFKNKYEDLIKNKNVNGLIIDLRNNPGGILQVCVEIADILVPEGKVVYTVDKAGNEEAMYSDRKHIDIPLVILVNEGSASASEVLTGAVKDYEIGKVIGTKTYGKGVVQTLKSLGDGTYIKLTTAEYFSPKGNKIDGLGIEPDIVVELPEDVEDYYNLSYEEDTQLQTAIKEINNMISEQ